MILPLLISMVGFHAQAQWRIRLHTGAAFSTKPTRSDSLSAARTTGFQGGISAAYFWGHLGISTAVNGFSLPLRTDAQSTPPPALLNRPDSLSVAGGGLSGVTMVAGPEFCFACGNKVKLHLGIRAGITRLSMRDLRYTRQQANTFILLYQNSLLSKAPFTWNISFGGHYFMTPRYGIGLNAEYQHFRVSMTNRDYRLSFLSSRILREPRSLISLAASVVYKL